MSAADRSAALRLISVSRETAERLDAFAELLIRWQARINLISSATLDQLWTRHIADSYQLLRLLPSSGTVVDIGSGAGFPGVILAIASLDCPDLRIVLVESNLKRCAFLREALRITGGRAELVAGRVEEVDRERWSADVVTARAVASLSDLLAMAYPLLKTGGQGLFPKGQDVELELINDSKY